MPISGNIRKFKFDLTLAKNNVFDPLCDDLISLAKNSLLEVVERVFSPYEGRNIVVDKIVIDLGNFNPNDLNSLTRNFKSELEDFVKKNLSESTLQNQERVREALLFFIQKGYFPWWVDGLDSFNKMLINLSDSFQFSDSLKLILTANKENYFRLLNILNTDAKNVVYHKLLFQNELIFKTSISFFERLLMNYQLPKTASSKEILEEVELFFIIQQMTTFTDPSSLFFKALKYFSGFLSIPFSNFFRFMTDEVIHSESNQVIKSLIEDQAYYIKGNSPLPTVSNKIGIREQVKSQADLNNPEGLISFFQNGLPQQLSFSDIKQLKTLFDTLLEKGDDKLLAYLQSISFYQNNEKLARLATLLDTQNYERLIDFLNSSAEKQQSVKSIQVIKSLIEAQADYVKAESSLPAVSNKIGIREQVKSQADLNNPEGLISFFQNGLPQQLSFSDIKQLKTLFDTLLEKGDDKLLAYLQSISFYQNNEKLARLATLLDTQNYERLIDFLNSSAEKSQSVKSINDFIKTLNKDKKLIERSNKIKLEIKNTSESNLKILISFFEKTVVNQSFTSLEELKTLLEVLLEKRDQNLFNYLSSSDFYQDQIKLSRLISLLSKDNYQALIAFLSRNQDQLNSVKYINEFITKKSQETRPFNLSEDVNLEISEDEALHIRLLSEDPLSTLISFFEKGISQANFSILSEYSKLLELLLNRKDKGLSDYLSKKAFFNSKIRLERFFSLLTDTTLQKLIDQLEVNNTALLIADLDKIFSDKSFVQNLLVYSSSSNITYNYKKSLLTDLLISKSEPRSASSFIYSFMQRISKESSLESNELFFEFSKMADKKKLDQSILNIFDVLYNQTSDEGHKSEKAAEQTKLKSEQAPSFQYEAAAVLAMSQSEKEKLLIDLFKQLPDSRLTLEMFIFHRAYSKVISLDVFSKVFQSLKTLSGLDFSKQIQTVISLIDPQRKNQFLLAINKVAFQIIISKGLGITPAVFSESLTTTLINLYPQIFKKDKFQKAEAISVEENTLQQLVKKVTERSKANDKQQTLDVEKFDSLLRLKQDILENQLSVIFSEEIISFQDSFASIIASKETLLAFLNQNYLDHELIMAFSEITLQSETSKELEKIINNENESILNLEEELMLMQRSFNFISLNFNSLKVILRTFLFKKLGVLNDLKKFSAPEFSIDFLEDIKRENYLNFQQLAFYLRSEELKKNPSKLAESLAVFNASSKFSITNPKLKNELFYKDLVYGFLETDQIPEWASIENFNQQDAILFIKSAINSGDKSFIDKLLSSTVIIERLLNNVEYLTPIEIKKLYQLIHLKSANFELYSVVELLESFLEKVTLSSAMSNNLFFLHLILREAFWKQTSLISLIEKLMPFIQSKSKKTKKQILTFISSEFNISKKLIELEKNVQFSATEFIEVLKYYLEFNMFPKHLKLYEKQIQSQIGQFLLKDNYVLMELLREYKYKPLELERLFVFIPLESIINSFDEVALKKQTLSYSLASVLKKLIKSSTFKMKSKLGLLINLATSFEHRVTHSTMSIFIKNLKKENARGHDEFVSLLKEEWKESTDEEQKKQYQLLEDIEFSQQKAELTKKETLADIDILDYYLEIGSVNYESKSLSKNELFQIFLKSIKEAELLTKKMVFEWAKSKLKLTRLRGIIPQDKRPIFMNLIHPDMSKIMVLFSNSMEQVLNASIEKLLSIKTQSDLELKIIQYWLKKNIYLDSPFQLIVYLFDEVLDNQQLTSVGFFKDFRDAEIDHALETSNFIFTLKRTYDNYKNQLSENEAIDQEAEISDLNQVDSDTIVIQNAGLILLWPFFFRLFDKCGLLIDKKFKDDQAVQKGVLMMQYLVTGSLKINENELVLNKILCGVAQRTPIDVTIEIDNVEIEMCDSLLKGVLQNWEKLNNSSIATLRETFLKREGILTPNELDFKLDIVKETFDMLLETIPWNISIVQTTFMENRINVDWK